MKSGHHQKLHPSPTASRFLESRRRVAFCVATALSDDFTRLKISGIAPWSPCGKQPGAVRGHAASKISEIAPWSPARDIFTTKIQPTRRTPESRRGRRSVKIRVIGVHFRLKISGMAPWSPLRGGTEGRERSSRLKISGIARPSPGKSQDSASKISGIAPLVADINRPCHNGGDRLKIPGIAPRSPTSTSTDLELCSASSMSESRRGRLPAPVQPFRSKAPPQDFWEPLVVANRAQASSSVVSRRLRSLGTAAGRHHLPRSCRDPLPPQDFCNRAVVAPHHHRLCVQGHPPPQRFLESRGARAPPEEPLTIEYIEAAALLRIAPWSPLPLAVRFPRMFRLKISGIAPWSPMRTGLENKRPKSASKFLGIAVEIQNRMQ